MDFYSIFNFLLKSFEEENVNFAVIGGFAMQAFGVTRTTSDIDMLIVVEDKEKVKNILLKKGYKLYYENNDVMNFFGDSVDTGRLDFLIAHRQYAKAMLERAEYKEILDGKFKIKVIKIEDQIGLKVQSSTNDRERYSSDLADIQMLIETASKNIDLKLVREYFKIFDRENELDKILKC